MSHRNVARELPDPVRRTLVTPCAVDGWALYALDLAIETGFAADAAEIFAIRLAQLRAVARGVIDLGLHTEGFTPAGAADMLIQLLPIERDEALADVRRACGWPTYSLAAAVGRREIVELRDAWAQRRRGAGARTHGRTGAEAQNDWTRFHAELLLFGGLPVSLSRWGMDLGLEE